MADAKHANYRARHQEEIRARRRAAYAANAESERARAAAWREANPEKAKESRRRSAATWRAANLDLARERERQYSEAHRAERAAAARTRRADNPALAADGWARWKAANPDLAAEQRRAWDRKWATDHPELNAHKAARRRARTFSAEGSHTVEEWLLVCHTWKGACAYCGRVGPLTRDHVVPLARGGSDYIANILPACRECNTSKHNRLLSEWRPELEGAGLG
ncbi:MAG: HNH endonuclease [Actinomycetota bacterium]|nr:HNH endonuclease [Actinomycetota bacterium]